MKEVLVVLLLGLLISGYAFGLKISRDIRIITRNNKYIRGYKNHKDSYVSGLAFRFQIKDDMKWKEMPPYIHASSSLIKKIEEYLKEKNYNKADD